MRAMWKGAVSFGLVNVPVRMYAATEEHDIRFHQVHRADGGRIRYKRSCSVCGEEVGYSDIAKGFEGDDGSMVMLTEEDLAGLPVSSGREIDVLEFVPAEQVDPLLLDRSYYLEPDAKALKPYTLLREALSSTERLAIAKVALRQRETLAVLRVRENVIVLQTMLWPDEIRAAEFSVFDTDVTLRPQELTMATSLIDSLTDEFEPASFEDEYTAAVRALIDAKLGRGEVQTVAVPRDDGSAEVVDLLEALQRSVDRAQQKRGDSGSTAKIGVVAADTASEEETDSDVESSDDSSESSRGANAAKATAKKATKAPTKRATTPSTSDSATTDKPPAKKATAKKAPAKKVAAKRAAPRNRRTA